MPDLPSLDDLSSSLLSDQAPGQGAPGGDDVPQGGDEGTLGSQTPFGQSGPGGLSLENESQRADGSQPPPDLAALRSKVDELTQKLEQETKRRTDSQAAFHRADQESQIAKKIIQEIQAYQQRERDILERAQNSQPPTVEDWDELISDGNKLKDYMENASQWLQGNILSQLKPFLDQANTALQILPQFVSSREKEAVAEAKRRVKEEFGREDFDSVVDSIREEFSRGGQAASALMLDPDNLVDAYVLLKRRRGESLTASPRQQPPPKTPAPGNRRSEIAKTLAEISPMAAQIARTAGMDPNIKLSEDEAQDLVREIKQIRGTA